jgi:hypothetical protein
MLDGIPFGCASRVVRDGDGDAKRVAQLGLEFGLPSPGIATIAATRLTFRRSKRQYSVNFLYRRSTERLLWDAEQGKQLALQVGELDLEDLQGVCALGQLVPGGEAE